MRHNGIKITQNNLVTQENNMKQKSIFDELFTQTTKSMGIICLNNV